MGILCAGATDIGRKRKTNQDSICLDHSHNFYAVADGMGGHNGGDIASQLSVKVMPEFFVNNSTLEPQLLMKNMIQEVNRAILQKAEENPELHGMGTTVSAIHFSGPTLVIGNVGDSRVYMVNNQNIFSNDERPLFRTGKIEHGNLHPRRSCKRSTKERFSQVSWI